MPPSPHSRLLTYAGVFLVAQATLMLEILLTRITSVSAWYHLAFFVISLGMLGMTAGAVLVFLFPTTFADVPRRLAQSALLFALSIPIGVGIALSVPLLPVTSLMSFFALFGIGAALAVPFVTGGATLTLALTRSDLPANVVYGVDLVGAAAGCVLVIPLLDAIDAPSAALISAAVAAASAAVFALAERRIPWAAAIATALLVALGMANASRTPPPLRPTWVKGLYEDPKLFVYTGWNTYSRVTVEKDLVIPPLFWAKGRNTPPEALAPRVQRHLKIDGAAGTVLTQIGKGPQEHGYQGWDISAFAHHLRPKGPAAVIGVGGGRDVLEAVRVGHEPVIGIELNKLIVDLHHGPMGKFTGIAQLPGVTLVNDEARSYLARDERKYSVLTMSLIDTWASTGAGAYSLSENGLYTVEAWRIFLSRLSPGGVFTVSRWYFVDAPGETARILTLAMETLWSMGANNPLDHIVLVQNELVSTLLVSPTPFSDADVDRVQAAATFLGFNMLVTPRRIPVHPMLKSLAKQHTRSAMWAWAEKQQLDLTPPTDARPFFFNMLKASTWLDEPDIAERMDLAILGNLQATQTLLYAMVVMLLLTLITVVWPMWARRTSLSKLGRLDVAAALAYFALIGLGFMLVEIGLLSRLNVFLGHPTLALAVLLSGIIFFTGIGSLLSERLPVERPRVAMLYPLIPAGMVLLVAVAMLPTMHAFEGANTPTRVSLSVAMLIPPALGLGLCFPLGLKLVERMERARGAADQARGALGPWLWGINGAFGVCASGLALASSMAWGIQTTLLLGAACYLLLPLMTRRLSRSAG